MNKWDEQERKVVAVHPDVGNYVGGVGDGARPQSHDFSDDAANAT
jgi:hypothetical protein